MEISFPASHQLTLADQGLESLHEHVWVVRAQFQGPDLDPDGLLVDFIKVKKLLAEIADKFHGKDLTKAEGLADNNPSAENLARYFYQQLLAMLDTKTSLTAVSVQEAPGCWATYQP